MKLSKNWPRKDRKDTQRNKTMMLGYVIWTDHQHIPQQALYREVLGFKRRPGRPRTNWRDTFKTELQRLGLTGKMQRTSTEELHRNVAQSIHMVAGWIRVKANEDTLASSWQVYRRMNFLTHNSLHNVAHTVHRFLKNSLKMCMKITHINLWVCFQWTVIKAKI